MNKIKGSEQIGVVFDNHSLFAEAMAKLLEELHLFSEVRSFTKDDDLLQYFIVKGPKANIFLFADYYLETKTILSLINGINRSNKDVKIVIVSSLTNPVLIKNLLTYSINGIISKSSGTAELIDCIEQVNVGKVYISDFIQQVIDSYSGGAEVPFTEREINILHYIAKGLSVDATAEVMNLSRHTIAAHRRKMLRKANCNSVTELLAYARKIELI